MKKKIDFQNLTKKSLEVPVRRGETLVSFLNDEPMQASPPAADTERQETKKQEKPKAIKTQMVKDIKLKSNNANMQAIKQTSKTKIKEAKKQAKHESVARVRDAFHFPAEFAERLNDYAYMHKTKKVRVIVAAVTAMMDKEGFPKKIKKLG